MAGRKALHVWIDAALYDALQARKEREEEKTFRDIVEKTLFLGQRVYEEEGQQGNHTPDEGQRESDLLLIRILREAGLARSLAEILLDYFLGPPAAQAHYERANRQIGELLTISSPEQGRKDTV